MGRLQDQIAVVVGASRGIGRVSALALAREGAHLVIMARAEGELESLAGEIRALGREALVVVGDASLEADVQRLHDETIARFGRCDLLLNNAGVGKYGALDTLSAGDYDWMMNINMRATFLATRLFYPAMRERQSGTILFLGSVAGLNGIRHETVYCATKHAQYGFARALDYEAREHNVKVSYIAPGGVDTYFAFGTGRTEGDPKLKEYLDADSVADAVVFAATQPPKSRVFLIGMRPMREALS
jgi:3-oxoacyl-[acyl-carrier protein] reductase